MFSSPPSCLETNTLTHLYSIWAKPPQLNSPAGKPSQISSQSYRHRAPGGGVVSGSMSKLSNSTTISDILGAKIMKVQSRLLGYFSGKPGVLMTPRGAVKFLEHSGPARRGAQFLKCQVVFGQSDWFSLGRGVKSGIRGQNRVRERSHITLNTTSNPLYIFYYKIRHL